jgi:diguanylate cyclase (GGDEF)-like protein
MLAAVVPVVVTTLLVFAYVRSELIDAAAQRLAEQSKSYGLERYDRLAQAAAALERLARFIKMPKEQRASLRSIAGLQLSDLMARNSGGEPEQLIGTAFRWPALTDDERQRLSAGDVVVRTIPDGSRGAGIVLFVSAVFDGSERTWAGRVSDAYLWQDAEQPAMPRFVMIDDRGAVLYSSGDNAAPLSPTDVALLRAPRRGVDAVNIGGRPVVFSSWRLFMRPRFGVGDWTTVVISDRDAVLQPLAAFRNSYPAIVGATLLVVMLLSLVQIRRSHRPLEQLVDTTRRFAGGDFHARAEVRDGTEFTELAVAMNDMSARIGRQLSALRTLADIDRLMLESVQLEPVLDTVVAQTCRMIDCDAIAIVLADGDAPEIGRRFSMRPGVDTQMSVERIPLTADDLSSLATHRGGVALAPGALVPLGAPALAYPVVVEGTVRGALSLQFGAQTQPDADTRQFLRDIADRLAVTLANHARACALIRQAHYDGLTGLPNRELFRDRLDQALVRARRDRRPVGLLFIDLDRFKHVNDANGHSSGDQLLRQAAARLRECMGDSDTVARLGGDEFTVVLPDIASTLDAAAAAEAAIDRLRTPFFVEGTEHHVSASVGIACFPEDGENAEELLRSADMAMYRAKGNGRGCFAFFEEHMNADASSRRRLELELRHALSRGELLLHYQPMVSAVTGEVASIEALVRWRHPDLGLVPPAQFIPVAEDTGLILELGSWVVREALSQMRRWRAAGIEPGRLSLNASARQLRTPRFADQLLRELDAAAMEGQRLELEVTETVLIEHIDAAREQLVKLRERGVRIAIDDFGTGYSSLRYLQDLPFDSIKIDRAFIDAIDSRAGGAAIVEAVISMAHALDKEVVAEGVERPAQLAYLSARGCDLLQGFLLFHPMTAEDLTRVLRDSRATPVPARSGAAG